MSEQDNIKVATAEALGVGNSTIDRDLKEDAPSGAKSENTDTDNQEVIVNNAPSGAKSLPIEETEVVEALPNYEQLKLFDVPVNTKIDDHDDLPF